MLSVNYLSIKPGKILINKEEKKNQKPGSLTTSTMVTWHLKAVPKGVDFRARNPGRGYRRRGQWLLEERIVIFFPSFTEVKINKNSVCIKVYHMMVSYT